MSRVAAGFRPRAANAIPESCCRTSARSTPPATWTSFALSLDEGSTDYFGASYGTEFGATYAELFPERVGRMVLDGALDPTVSSNQLALASFAGSNAPSPPSLTTASRAMAAPSDQAVQTAEQQLIDFLAEHRPGAVADHVGPRTHRGVRHDRNDRGNVQRGERLASAAAWHWTRHSTATGRSC